MSIKQWEIIMKDIAEITKRLGHKDISIRRDAVETLGMMKDERAVDALITVLKDKNRFVRKEAVLALGKIGDLKVVEHLTRALETEKDEFVKDYLRKVIERLNTERT